MKALLSTAICGFIPFHSRMKPGLSWPAWTNYHNHINNVLKVRFPVGIFGVILESHSTTPHTCENKYNSQHMHYFNHARLSLTMHVLYKQMHGNFPASNKKDKQKNTILQVDKTFISFLLTFSFDKAVEIK